MFLSTERLPALRAAVAIAPPDGSFPVLDACTNDLATNTSCADVKLQWFVPCAAGVDVIGAPVLANFVQFAGVVFQSISNLLVGAV